MTRIQWAVFIIIVVAVVVGGIGLAFLFGALDGRSAADVLRRLR